MNFCRSKNEPVNVKLNGSVARPAVPTVAPGGKDLSHLQGRSRRPRTCAPSTTPAATTGTTPSTTTPDSGATASTAAPTTSAIAGGSN